MRQMACVVLLALLMAGCLSSSAPDVKAWSIGAVPPDPSRTRQLEGTGQLYGSSRLGSVVVNAPYDRTQFTVHRADGTDAADHYNVFSAAPSSLLRAAAQSGLGADGRLGHVVHQSSVLTTDAQVEIQVKELSLDCREPGRRAACAAVSLDVIKVGRGPRTLASTGEGRAAVDAQDGDYGRAFSQAFSNALDAALLDALGPRRK